MAATQRSSRSTEIVIGSCGEIALEPVADHGLDHRVVVAEEEVVDLGEKMQIGGLAGVGEEVDRLLGGRHAVVGRVQEQERARRDYEKAVGADKETK